MRPGARECDATLENRFLRVVYHAHTGRMDVVWRNGDQLIGIESGSQLADGQTLVTSAYIDHELVVQSTGTREKVWRELTIRSSQPGKPALLQHVLVSD